MSALFIVVPLALLVSGAAVWAFIWSVRHGQMDDLTTPAMRMLQNDDPANREPVETPETPLGESGAQDGRR